MDKIDLILAAEKQFARRVTLGVIVQRPLSVWHYLIPGMFIFDFVRRNHAIREYTQHFLFPRHLALQAAQRLDAGDEKDSVNRMVRSGIEDWLKSLKLDSHELALAQKAAVDILIEHYRRLLATEGTDYNDLLRHAYPSRKDFQQHVQCLSASEKQIDQALLHLAGGNALLAEKLQTEARQVEIERKRMMEENWRDEVTK